MKKPFVIKFSNMWKKVVKKCELNKYMTVNELNDLHKLIETSYCDGYRFYHTLEHLIECLDLFLDAKHLCHNPLNVLFAILFHDAVYDSKCTDNEEQSAQLMMSHYQYHKAINANLVYAYIVATKDHEITNSNDCNIVRDIDLSIFGKHSRRFIEYDHMIMYEYTHTFDFSLDDPLSDYASRRCEVLKHFFSENIYAIEYFRTKFQTRAEQNLRLMINHYESLIK